MSLTSAVAHAAAAAAAGAGKKAAQVQLQAELNTDDEWNKFLLRDGLLVVDVYTEWCGPCIGMVGNLKKIKVELGGDNLHLAVAKSDTINCLQRFRNRSQPTWMFLAGGQLVNVVFGADAPRISRTIEQELRNEELVRRGERERVRRAPHELTPPEQEMANAEEKLQTERREREAAAAEAARWARREARALRLEAHFPDACPALLLPHAQKHLRKFADALEPFGVVVSDKMPLVVGRDGCRLLAAEEPVLDSDVALVALAERPALALLLKKQPDREGDVIELSRRAIFGDGQEAEEGLPPRRALADELAAGGLPGVLVPPDRQQRAALLDILFPKMVGAVVEPPVPAEPPHVAVMFGAWQRRAVLGAAARLGPDLLRFGFFADASVDEPRLLCKTLEQYDERVEKDYSETIVVMVSSGAAHTLAALGPLHTSADSVSGADECARFFPPGYSAPDHKPKPKAKKKKKKRHETKEETIEDSPEAAPGECAEDAAAEAEAEAEAEGEPDAEAEDDDDDAHAQDKATSPPPL